MNDTLESIIKDGFSDLSSSLVFGLVELLTTECLLFVLWDDRVLVESCAINVTVQSRMS